MGQDHRNLPCKAMHIGIDFIALKNVVRFQKKVTNLPPKSFDRRAVVGMEVIISMGESKRLYQWRLSSNKVDALYDFKR